MSGAPLSHHEGEARDEGPWDQTEKELPQPQEEEALGFWTLK
jgi:hypothetical protein